MESVQLCPAVRVSGSCQDDACPFSHDLLFCELCQHAFADRSLYQTHIQGKKHQRRAAARGGTFQCPICDKTVLGLPTWKMHIRGRAHISNAGRQGVDAEVEPEEAPIASDQVLCEVCNFVVDASQWATHVQRRNHREREQFLAFKAVFDDASKDKHGVSVSHTDGGIDFGIVEVDDAIRGVSVEFSITLTDPTARVKIDSFRLSSTLSTAAGRTPASFFAPSIEPGASTLWFKRERRLHITFRQPVRGQFEDRMEITFEDTALRQKFVIIRLLKAVVGSQAEYDLLKPSKPYTPKKRTKREPETNVVSGIPPRGGNIKWVTTLPMAEIPKTISSILSTAGSVSDIVAQLKRTVLPTVFNTETYSRFFKTLLWVEEHRMEHDLQIYDIPDAVLTKYNQYYFLPVPGLAEKRPSVLTGDRILVRPQNGTTGRWFEGHVYIVRREEVGLCFHVSFPVPTAGQRHLVHFKLNRYPLRRQHQALDTAFAPQRLLSPAPTHLGGMTRSRAPIQPFNPSIKGNLPQLDAIRAIVHRPPGSVPFVVFGPPGTGKTITFVEAIRQVLLSNPSARIMACAPSNSAADLIALRLIKLGPDKVFRYYAHSRSKDTVPDELMSFTYVDMDGHFSLPPLATVKRFRVVVSTCVSASFAHGIGVPRGHFSHIFVDEAGQATEPEVMISVKTMADLSTNVVLAGDPKQLGPIIRSAVARTLKLDISYMERLMGEEIYDERRGHGITVVKLTKNYRSHDAILAFPNARFYKGELEPCGEAKVIDSCLGSPILPSSRFPIIFHAMSGRDDREASSPSFFNIHEVQQVKAYVEALRNDRRLRVSNKEIGIIAPYHAQCQKIRTLLRPIGEDIKVGSVEEFQGQERRIIIISTVRSSREFVEYDLRHTLGFVANPRRFNVAVTRAQALLIVVGDPAVLSLDPLWRSFLNYIHINRGWKGIPISWDPHAQVRDSGGYDAEFRELGASDMNEFARRMEGLTLDGAEAVDEADANVDRPWREVE
ncbi:P-loop containing nucleoside triphosphate hydrolase protein [Amylostereum chailletii]|nr:P-loop containing nucleoside triphosphate hydrolase protein [Amylostereum chailletii]